MSGFCNYPDFDGVEIGEIAALSGAEQRQRFAGTLTPTLRLAVDGERTRVRGTLDHWAFPSETEPLPPVDDDWSLPAGELDPEPGLTRTTSRREDGPFW